MAKIRRSSNGKKKKNGGIVNLVEKISLLIGRNNNKSISGSNYNYTEEPSYVPEDVKEGHFAVMAVNSNEPKRFVVPLSYLSHPMFQRLLEQAAEEYGFDRQGALTIPCRPYELETILADNKWQQQPRDSSSRAGINSSNSWDSSCNSMVEIY